MADDGHLLIAQYVGTIVFTVIGFSSITLVKYTDILCVKVIQGVTLGLPNDSFISKVSLLFKMMLISSTVIHEW